jgi:Family of unknown function (DUF6603)
VDDGDLLVDVVRTTIGNAAGDELHALLVAARSAANSADWQSRTAAFRASYRARVKSQLRNFVSAPVFALPGVPALVDLLLDRALNEGAASLADSAKEISLGPVSASLGLPAVMLTPPALNPALPPALIGFRPPTGLALSFGSGPASGGGALDYQGVPNPRLSGGFGLKLGVLQVGALGILEEVDGGASLLTLLSARFAPGIQLGFGFAISGVGGLIGVNRAADVAALEAQFRSGALVNALFGDNPIGNAVNTLNTLGAVFRARQGAHVFGPTLQISWLKVAAFTLFSADLGVFMALPGPSRVDIIGSARAAIPPVFQLRLDVRGEIDLGRRIIGLHAVIVDSHVMGVFRMQGEALFRLRCGDDPYAVLTIGGFFPGFNPAPAEVPAHLPRVGMALDVPVPVPIYLRAEGYLAVTSNTLQFGGLLEAGFDFLLRGPEDVGGLKPGAVRRTYPAHGAFGVETDKCVYVEFAATDLPWRYTAKVDGHAPGWHANPRLLRLAIHDLGRGRELPRPSAASVGAQAIAREDRVRTAGLSDRGRVDDAHARAPGRRCPGRSQQRRACGVARSRAGALHAPPSTDRSHLSARSGWPPRGAHARVR